MPRWTIDLAGAGVQRQEPALAGSWEDTIIPDNRGGKVTCRHPDVPKAPKGSTSYEPPTAKPACAAAEPCTPTASGGRDHCNHPTLQSSHLADGHLRGQSRRQKPGSAPCRCVEAARCQRRAERPSTAASSRRRCLRRRNAASRRCSGRQWGPVLHSSTLLEVGGPLQSGAASRRRTARLTVE